MIDASRASAEAPLPPIVSQKMLRQFPQPSKLFNRFPLAVAATTVQVIQKRLNFGCAHLTPNESR